MPRCDSPPPTVGRPAMVEPTRRQLVGLLPVDPDELLPEGAALPAQANGIAPAGTAGHVTSSYRSAALGRTFALALIRDGRSLEGTVVLAPTLEGTVAAAVTAPVLYDPEGARRDGPGAGLTTARRRARRPEASP